MVEANTVETVFERQHALDLVCLDHPAEHVANDGWLPALHDRLARQIVGDRENAAQIVGRMAPLRGEPRIVEVEPADHRPDVESGLHRVQFERCARHTRATRHYRARHDRSQQPGACRVLERLKAACQRVHQAKAGSVMSLGAADRVAVGIFRNRHEDRVRIRTLRGFDVGRRHLRCAFRAARTSGSPAPRSSRRDE